MQGKGRLHNQSLELGRAPAGKVPAFSGDGDLPSSEVGCFGVVQAEILFLFPQFLFSVRSKARPSATRSGSKAGCGFEQKGGVK